MDVDQYHSLPDAKACIVTSAEKYLQSASRDAIVWFKEKGKQSGTFVNDATNGASARPRSETGFDEAPNHGSPPRRAKDSGDAGIVEQVDRRPALGQVEQVLHSRAVGSRPIGPPGLGIGRA